MTEIAKQRQRSIKTISSQLARAREKLGIENVAKLRIAAADLVRERGIA